MEAWDFMFNWINDLSIYINNSHTNFRKLKNKISQPHSERNFQILLYSSLFDSCSFICPNEFWILDWMSRNEWSCLMFATVWTIIYWITLLQFLIIERIFYQIIIIVALLSFLNPFKINPFSDGKNWKEFFTMHLSRR